MAVRHGVLHRRSHIYIHLHLRHLADTLNQSGLLYIQEWSNSKGLDCKHLKQSRVRNAKVKIREAGLQKGDKSQHDWNHCG